MRRCDGAPRARLLPAARACGGAATTAALIAPRRQRGPLIACAGASSSRQLVTQLPKCRSVQQLKAQLKKYGAGIDHVAASAALCHLAKLDGTSDAAALVAAPLVAALLRSVEACSARQLANSLWALGQLQLQGLPQARQLLAAISAQLLAGGGAHLRSSNLIEAANIAVGLAKLQRQDLPLLDALADHVPRLLQPAGGAGPGAGGGASSGTPAAAGPEPAAARGASSSSSSSSTRELSGILWAAASLRYYCPALCGAVASELAPQLQGCCCRTLSTALWALATLGHPCDELFEAAARLLLSAELRQRCSPRDLASNAWSLATAAALQGVEEHSSSAGGAAASAGLLEPFAEAASAMVLAAAQAPLASVPATSRQQLLQGILTFEVLGRPLLGVGLLAGNAAAGAAGGPPELRALVASCREAWLRQARRPQQSALHKEVLQVGACCWARCWACCWRALLAGAVRAHLAGLHQQGPKPAAAMQALQQLGYPAECEAPVAGGLLSVDVLLRAPAGAGAARSVALEVSARRGMRRQLAGWLAGWQLPNAGMTHLSDARLAPAPACAAGRRWMAPPTSAATRWAAPGAAWVARVPGNGCWRGWAWRPCSWRTGAGTSCRGRRRARCCCWGCWRGADAEGGRGGASLRAAMVEWAGCWLQASCCLVGCARSAAACDSSGGLDAQPY
jgi:hypothetical protein